METPKQKPFDLEQRIFLFAKRVRAFVKKLPRTMAAIEDARQLIRASGSVGANYIEANDSLGKKDFAMRVRICRKEAKESRYWLQLLDVQDDISTERESLSAEADKLMKIFGAILRKADNA